MDDDVRSMFEDMRAEMREMRAEMRGMRVDIAGELEEMRRENAAEHAETRRQFHVVTEGISARVDRTLEAMQLLDGKVDRNVERLDYKLDRGFADLMALIRFSHS